MDEGDIVMVVACGVEEHQVLDVGKHKKATAAEPVFEVAPTASSSSSSPSSVLRIPDTSLVWTGIVEYCRLMWTLKPSRRVLLASAGAQGPCLLNSWGSGGQTLDALRKGLRGCPPCIGASDAAAQLPQTVRLALSTLDRSHDVVRIVCVTNGSLARAEQFSVAESAVRGTWSRPLSPRWTLLRVLPESNSLMVSEPEAKVDAETDAALDVPLSRIVDGLRSLAAVQSNARSIRVTGVPMKKKATVQQEEAVFLFSGACWTSWPATFTSAPSSASASSSSSATSSAPVNGWAALGWSSQQWSSVVPTDIQYELVWQRPSTDGPNALSRLNAHTCYTCTHSLTPAVVSSEATMSLARYITSGKPVVLRAAGSAGAGTAATHTIVLRDSQMLLCCLLPYAASPAAVALPAVSARLSDMFANVVHDCLHPLRPDLSLHDNLQEGTRGAPQQEEKRAGARSTVCISLPCGMSLSSRALELRTRSLCSYPLQRLTLLVPPSRPAPVTATGNKIRTATSSERLHGWTRAVTDALQSSRISMQSLSEAYSAVGHLRRAAEELDGTVFVSATQSSVLSTANSFLRLSLQLCTFASLYSTESSAHALVTGLLSKLYVLCVDMSKTRLGEEQTHTLVTALHASLKVASGNTRGAGGGAAGTSLDVHGSRGVESKGSAHTVQLDAVRVYSVHTEVDRSWALLPTVRSQTESERVRALAEAVAALEAQKAAERKANLRAQKTAAAGRRGRRHRHGTYLEESVEVHTLGTGDGSEEAGHKKRKIDGDKTVDRQKCEDSSGGGHASVENDGPVPASVLELFWQGRRLAVDGKHIQVPTEDHTSRTADGSSSQRPVPQHKPAGKRVFSGHLPGFEYDW